MLMFQFILINMFLATVMSVYASCVRVQQTKKARRLVAKVRQLARDKSKERKKPGTVF